MNRKRARTTYAFPKRGRSRAPASLSPSLVASPGCSSPGGGARSRFAAATPEPPGSTPSRHYLGAPSPRPPPRPFCGYPGLTAPPPERAAAEDSPPPPPNAAAAASAADDAPSVASLARLVRSLGDAVDARMDRIEAAVQRQERRLRALEAGAEERGETSR